MVGDEDLIVGAIRQLILEREQRFNAKLHRFTSEVRHTLEQFHREHAIVEGMNQ